MGCTESLSLWGRTELDTAERLSSSSSQMCGASETCIKDVNLELVRLYVNVVENIKWDESSETNFG